MKRFDFARLIALSPLALLAPKIPIPQAIEEYESLVPESLGMWEGVTRWRFAGGLEVGPFNEFQITKNWIDFGRSLKWPIEYIRPGWTESIVHHQ